MQVENKVLSTTRRKMGKPEIERIGIEETRPYQGHSLSRASSALLCPPRPRLATGQVDGTRGKSLQ
jgi:hypothetical protein